jgi:hypothetical protein
MSLSRIWYQSSPPSMEIEGGFDTSFILSEKFPGARKGAGGYYARTWGLPVL